jgi:hypothetical protein
MALSEQEQNHVDELYLLRCSLLHFYKTDLNQFEKDSVMNIVSLVTTKLDEARCCK